MVDTRDIEALFLNRGQLLDTACSPRFTLHARKTVWLLETGAVDIFAVETSAHTIASPHILLATIKAPALLFGFPPVQVDARHVLTVATRPDTRLWKLPLSVVEEALVAQKNLYKQLAHLVCDWTGFIGKILENEPLDCSAVVLQPLHQAKLKAGEAVTPMIALHPEERSKVSWLHTVEGKLLLVGNPEIPLSPFHFYPLKPHRWLKALKETTVRAAAVEEVFRDHSWERGLALFHETLLAYLEKTQKRADEKEIQQARTRKLLEQRALDEGLREVAATLDAALPMPVRQGDDPLFLACQALGKTIGVAMVMPATLPEGDIADKVHAICEASSVRYRRVSLAESWWQKDAGSLLGFVAEGTKPVALLNKPSGRYYLFDPLVSGALRVTKKRAQQLLSVAFAFTPSLPETVETGWKLLGRSIKERKGDVGALFMSGGFMALLALFPPIATQLLFNCVLPGKDMPFFYQVALGLFLAATSSSLFFLARSFAVVRLEGLVSATLQASLWDKLLKLPLSFFRQFSAGNLLYRVSIVEVIRSMLGGNALRILLSGLFSILYLALMIAYSPYLTLLALCLMAAGSAIAACCVLYNVRVTKRLFAKQGALNGTLVQLVSGVGRLRVAGAENRAFIHWLKQFTSTLQDAKRSRMLQNVVTVTNAMLPILTLAVLYAGYMLGNSPQMTLGAFLGFYVAFSAFAAAAFDVTGTLINLIPVVTLWDLAKEIVAAPAEAKAAAFDAGVLKGSVSVDNVSYRYQSGAPLTIDQVTIHANPGEFIAVVGPTGCGKSTLVNLLLGFDHPEKGAIYYNGKDLAGLDVRAVRKQIGTVLQDDAIISGSIWDNIACGRFFSYDDVMRAVELADFAEDLREFPMGLHTMLSAGSQTISGGQRQKLFIARALVGRPKILLFDEATSAFDNSTQSAVSHNIEMLDVTRIVIAHRLSTILMADRIYVMHQGSIIDKGTFKELAARPGIFADMVALQKI